MSAPESARSDESRRLFSTSSATGRGGSRVSRSSRGSAAEMTTSECVAQINCDRCAAATRRNSRQMPSWQDEVEVGVRFVEQQHRARPRVEERQQHHDLVEAAARARDVERRAGVALAVIHEDIRAVGVRWQQRVPEQPPDRLAQRFPGRRTAVRLHERVAKRLAGPPVGEQLVHLRLPVLRFRGDEPAHRAGEDHRKAQAVEERGRRIRRRPDMHLLGAVGVELHGDRPVVVPERDLHHAPIDPVLPELVEAAERRHRESRPRDGRERVSLRAALGARSGLPPAAKRERPGRDSLQHGRLPGVVRPDEHDLPRQRKAGIRVALETPNPNLADHFSPARRPEGRPRRRAGGSAPGEG